MRKAAIILAMMMPASAHAYELSDAMAHFYPYVIRAAGYDCPAVRVALSSFPYGGLDTTLVWCGSEPSPSNANEDWATNSEMAYRVIETTSKKFIVQHLN